MIKRPKKIIVKCVGRQSPCVIDGKGIYSWDFCCANGDIIRIEQLDGSFIEFTRQHVEWVQFMVDDKEADNG